MLLLPIMQLCWSCNAAISKIFPPPRIFRLDFLLLNLLCFYRDAICPVGFWWHSSVYFNICICICICICIFVFVFCISSAQCLCDVILTAMRVDQEGVGRTKQGICIRSRLPSGPVWGLKPGPAAHMCALFISSPDFYLSPFHFLG